MEELEKSSQSTASSSQVFLIHVCCGLALAVGCWVAHYVYSITLISDPTTTLRLIWYLKAIARGLLGLPIGALLNALGAFAFGAPVGLQYLGKSVNRSLLMSSFTHMGVVIEACFGAWPMPLDWERPWKVSSPPFNSLLLKSCVSLSFVGHCGILSRRERIVVSLHSAPDTCKVQDWPICVSYGAMAGYMVGMVGSVGLALMHTGGKQLKAE